MKHTLLLQICQHQQIWCSYLKNSWNLMVSHSLTWSHHQSFKSVLALTTYVQCSKTSVIGRKKTQPLLQRFGLDLTNILGRNKCELTNTSLSVSFTVLKARSVGLGPKWGSSPNWTTEQSQYEGITGWTM